MQSYKLYQRLLYPFFKADYYRYAVESETGFGFANLIRVLGASWIFVLVESLLIALVSFAYFKQSADFLPVFEGGPGENRSPAEFILGVGVGLLVFLVFFAIGAIFSGLVSAVVVFLYAAIGWVFQSLFAKHLAYEDLCRIAVVALTPTLLLNGVLFLFWDNGLYWLCQLLLALGFLIFGVSQQNRTGPQNRKT